MAKPARAVPVQSRNTNTTTICSSVLKTVCLHDWWLIKAEMDSKGRRLGVEGFASREKQGIRSFQSAAIVKRHDTVTLETVDGITVTLSGFINRSLTHQNGFPSEVCNQFLFGFPYYWEEYATRCFGEESTNKSVPPTISSLQGFNMSTNDGANSFLPVSLDDLPVTRIRDLLMYSLGDSANCMLTKNIFNDMLQRYSGSAFKHDGASVNLKKQSNCPVMTGDSVPDETPSTHKKTFTGDSVPDETPSTRKKTKVEQKSIGDNGISHATDMGTEEFQKIIHRSKMGVVSSSKGVATRSMTRLKNRSNKQEENLSSNTSVIHGLSDPIYASEASGNQYGGMVQKHSGSAFKHDGASVHINKESNCLVMNGDSVPNETPSTHKKTFAGDSVPDETPSTHKKTFAGDSVPDETPSTLKKTFVGDPLPDETPSTLKKTFAGDSVRDETPSTLSVPDETPSTRKKTKVEQKSRGDNGISHATDMGREEFQKIIHQSKMDVVSSSKGVATRSITRLKNTSNKQEENLSSNTSVTCGLSEPISASEASGNQYGGMVTGRNASNVSHATIVSGEETEAMETLDKSRGRRPSRLKTQNDSLFTSNTSGNECRAVLTRRNDSNVCHENIFSKKEVEVKESPHKSAVRRSDRLRNLKK